MKTFIIHKLLMSGSLMGILLTLTACGSGANLPTNAGVEMISNQRLTLSELSSVPLVGNTARKVYLQLSNHTNSQIDSLKVGLSTNAPIAIGDVDISQCSNNAQNCLVGVNLPASLDDGGFELDIIATNSKTQEKLVAKQLISYNKVSAINNIYIGALNNVVSKEAKTIAIPFMADKNLTGITISSQLKLTNSKIICNGQISSNIASGEMCTALVDIPATSSTIANISINALVDNKLQTSSVLNVAINNEQIANLIVTASNILIPSYSNTGLYKKQITVLNSGLVNATALITNAPAPFTVVLNTCATSIVPGQSCTFYVDATGGNAANLLVNMAYNNSKIMKSINFNAMYLPNGIGTELVLTKTSGSMENVQNNLNATGKTIVNIKNTGTVLSVENLLFSNMTNSSKYLSFESGIGYCATDGTQKLNPNESCNVVVKYAPYKQEATNTVPLVVTYKVIDTTSPIGIKYNQVSNILSLPFSAIGTSIGIGYAITLVDPLQYRYAIYKTIDSGTNWAFVSEFTPSGTNSAKLTLLRDGVVDYPSNKVFFVGNASTAGSGIITAAYITLNSQNCGQYDF